MTQADVNLTDFTTSKLIHSSLRKTKKLIVNSCLISLKSKSMISIIGLKEQPKTFSINSTIGQLSAGKIKLQSQKKRVLVKRQTTTVRCLTKRSRLTKHSKGHFGNQGQDAKHAFTNKIRQNRRQKLMQI